MLCDRQYGQEVGVASGNWAPQYIEKRANAFASMLLMPRELIETHLSQYDDYKWDILLLRGLKNKLQIGEKALLEHLQNLGYLSIDDRERLEE
jgi:Zn-dependent peptidase ImmA (M78 family)